VHIPAVFYKHGKYSLIRLPGTLKNP